MLNPWTQRESLFDLGVDEGALLLEDDLNLRQFDLVFSDALLPRETLCHALLEFKLFLVYLLLYYHDIFYITW